MSIFTSIFSRNKTPKKEYVASFMLTEYFIAISVFEKTSTELLFVDSRLKEISNDGYGKISEVVEEMIQPIETSLKTTLTDSLFVIPSFAVIDGGSKVLEPFRGAIKQIIKDFELNALGYVDAFEIIRVTEKDNEHWLFIERGEHSANLVLCGRDEVKKRLKVTSDADEVCAHIEESATKKVKIVYYSAASHEDDTTFERNLAGYFFSKVASEDLIKNIKTVLSEQFFGEQIKMTTESIAVVTSQNDSQKNEISSTANQKNQNLEVIPDENIIIEQSNISVPSNMSDKLVAASQSDDLQTNALIATEINIHENVSPTHNSVTDKNDEFDDFVVYENLQDLESKNKNHNGRSEISSHKNTQKESIEIVANEAKIVTKNTLKPKNENNEDNKIEYVHSNENEKSAEEQVAEATDGNTVSEAKEKSFRLPIGKIFTSWVLPTLFAVILAVFAGFLLFTHKADVTLVVKTDEFETSITLNDFSLKSLESEKELAASTDSTGTKEIGERAKGSVTIASFDDKVASFSAGTKIVAQDKIFRLDADVALDAATVDTSQGTKVASKKTVKASATFIGPDGNIDKGIDMTVNDNPKSLYYAVAESAFTGGSKQSVPAVSQEDIDSIDAKLNTQAENASKDAQMTDIDENTIVINDLSVSELEDVEYSAAVGDAKTEVQGTGLAKYKIYYGENAELIKAISQAIKTKMGDGYVFDQKAIEFETKKAELKPQGKAANLVLDVKVRVYVPPSRETIKKSMIMLPVSSINNKIVEQNNLSNVRYEISPNFSPFNMFMPVLGESINVKVISDSNI